MYKGNFETHPAGLEKLFRFLPKVWVFHFVEEIVELVALFGRRDLPSLPVVADVAVVAVPFHGNVTDSVTDILQSGNRCGDEGLSHFFVLLFFLLNRNVGSRVT